MSNAAAVEKLGLTERELQVWQRIALGKSSKEIATEFGTSVKTVDGQRLILSKKLGTHNAADLTRSAVAYGIITVELHA